MLGEPSRLDKDHSSSSPTSSGARRRTADPDAASRCEALPAASLDYGDTLRPIASNARIDRAGAELDPAGLDPASSTRG